MNFRLLKARGYFLILPALLVAQMAWTQCNNASQYPSTAIDLSSTNSAGVTQTITTCNFSGEYAVLINAVAGNTYRFTSSIATDYFTIRSGSSGGPVVGSGTQPLSVVAASGGTLYAHINSSSACLSDVTCRQTAVQCTSCSGGGCINSTVYPSLNISLAPANNGNVQQITSCQFAGEYYSVTDVISGKTYTVSNNNATHYITVRVGTFNGPILAQGTTPVMVTTTSSSNLFVHTNSNSSCGTNSTCSVSTIQCTNCLCTNSSQFPSTAVSLNPTNTSGSTQTITSCNFASEYAQLTNVQSGKNYTFTSSVGTDYLTLHSGTFNGPVVAQGTTPLNYTTASAADLFLHINTNSACGTSSSCRVTAAQCNDCVIPPTCIADPASPANGATLCPNTSVTLSWAEEPTATSYDVYFGTTTTPPFVSNVEGTSYLAGLLGTGNYYWQIVPRNAAGPASGCSVWDFAVQDNTPPSVTCKSHTVALDSSGTASIVAADVHQGSSDNCGTVNLVSVSPNYFDCTTTGSNTVTLTVNDGNGNTNTCTATVTVQDDLPPVAQCQNITVQLDATGNATITHAQVDNGSSDNCSFTLGLNVSSFTCANVGINTVTLTATDASTNTHSCMATVTVQDNVAPVALCQNVTVQLDASGNGSVTAAQVNNNSTDACSIQTMTVSPSSFTCANVGPNTVTLTVTDNNSNTASCTSTVTVQDLVPPVAQCQNLGITLESSGNYTVTPAQINNGSSDACGIQALSVWPSQFACGQIGTNTVTLTLTDVNGNSSTCTATVTVAPFVIITNVAVTAETCQGAGNGTITITATTLGGNLMYSVNGGITYSASNFFGNLSPGTYSIKVLAQGTTGCAATATATVGAGPALQTWYKDFDNDNYSDGLTQVSCAQPTGFKQAGELLGLNNDCNDNDALQYPGQTWYRDQDNDGYSNGQTLVQCLKPSGYKHASQLVQTSGDCNDNNAAIHPAATEVCNNLDDDCDGQIDEGLGSLTYVGNVVFSTQAQVNAWSQCYTIIQGNLLVQNAGIVNLNTLANLVQVTGNVTIKNTALINLSGLTSLTTIGGTLTISTNNLGAKLQSLDGLEDLASVGGSLLVYSNFSLSDCCALYDLLNTPGAIGGAMSIFNNKTGCDNIGQINTNCAGGNNLTAPPSGSSSPAISVTETMPIGIYPNPASEEVTVEIGRGFTIGTIKMFDLQGKLVLEKQLTENAQMEQLDLSVVTPGVYAVHVLLDGAGFVRKLVLR